MPWVLRGLRDGILTTRWPRGGDDYFDKFDAAITVRTDTNDGRPVSPAVAAAVAACPTAAISTEPTAPPRPGALHPVRAVRDPRTGVVHLGARLRHGRAHPRDADRRAGRRNRRGGGRGARRAGSPGAPAAALRAHPSRRRRLRRQRRVGDLCPHQPALRCAPAGDFFHRQPPPRRHHCWPPESARPA